MASSSKSINYNIRPCKSIERKMMCEIVTKLNAFDQVSNYRYIGMGAKYFADFSLFHRKFGINKMYSMEINSEKNNVQRFQFNKPYKCINILFGNSNDLLNSSAFKWKNEKNIIWLDYDGGLNSNQLIDVESCIGKMESGSIVFVSFNSNLGEKFRNASPSQKTEIFKERINNDDLVKMIRNKDLAREKIDSTIHSMFDLVVKNKILDRNAVFLGEGEMLNIQQVAFFKYADSQASMLTLGWVIYSNDDIEKYEKCKFKNLEFYNDTNKPYNISVPNFTYKELAILNQNMPDGNYPIDGASFFSKEEIEKYKKIYKYYPTTFEASTSL